MKEKPTIVHPGLTTAGGFGTGGILISGAGYRESGRANTYADAAAYQEAALRQMAGSKQHRHAYDVLVGNTEKIQDLLRSYMQKLADDGKMYKLSQVKKMDILDTTGFLPPPDNGYGLPTFATATKEEQDAINKLDWYSFVPCFEKGALKLNSFRYIVFEILEMDPEEKTIKIRLDDYFKPTDRFWQKGVSTTMSMTILPIEDENGKRHLVQLLREDDVNFEQLYTQYTAKELGWTDKDYDTWMAGAVENSRYVTAKMQKEEHTDQCEQLASCFTLIIGRCNAMLEMNKPSRPINAKKTAPSGKRTVTYEKGAAPERKIRNVGSLRVQSAKVPRKPCMETVITYKVAKWTVRGFTRTYKSGKTAYIKPGVRKRKALEGTGETTATTIRFRKKEKKG